MPPPTYFHYMPVTERLSNTLQTYFTRVRLLSGIPFVGGKELLSGLSPSMTGLGEDITLCGIIPCMCGVVVLWKDVPTVNRLLKSSILLLHPILLRKRSLGEIPVSI